MGGCFSNKICESALSADQRKAKATALTSSRGQLAAKLPGNAANDGLIERLPSSGRGGRMSRLRQLHSISRPNPYLIAASTQAIRHAIPRDWIAFALIGAFRH